MTGDQWIITLDSEVSNINPSVELARHKKHCIYRVPKILRELNKDAYTPQLISFGPYHHGADHLRPMEHQKRLSLSNYLRRARRTLAEVVEAMRPEVRDLMDCYDGLEGPWTDEDRFLGLMILDGVFFLDLMIWHTVEFWRPYMTIRVWMDMLRLENQLPLAVLDILMEVGGHKVKSLIHTNQKLCFESHCSISSNRMRTTRSSSSVTRTLQNGDRRASKKGDSTTWTCTERM